MKQKAIFLDRDGVLTVEKGYVTSLEDLELFSYTKECIKKIHRADYLAIVITNQSAVGRHLMDEEELIRINKYLKKETKIDEIFYCPHYYNGKKKDKIQCECRKPNNGLVLKAAKKYNIDLSKSFFVGDRASDIQTGINSGMKTVLLESGYGTKRLETKVKPDYIFRTLKEFVYEHLLIE